MADLPTTIDLRQYAGQMYDQSTEGSCLPNALAANINMLEHLQGKPSFDAARNQIYYDAREAVGQQAKDVGAVPSVLFKTASTIGIAHESLWNYDTSGYAIKPTADVYADAAQHKITYNEIWDPTTLSASSMRDYIAHYLQEGKPVVIGFTVKYWYPAEHGDITTINPDNQHGNAGGDFGGHAGVVVGMSQDLCGGKGGYIVQNSWGTSVGDHGFMVIPYDEFPGQYRNPSTNFYNILSVDVATGFDGIDLTFTNTKAKVAEMFATEMNRAPETAAFNYFSGLVDSNTLSLSQIAAGIWNSPESQAIHAGWTTKQVVDNMYSVILGRQADAAGEAYYIDLIDHQHMNAGSLYYSTAEYVRALASTGGDGAAHDFLSGKINLAEYYGITMQVDGSHIQQARGIISQASHDMNQNEIVKIGIAHDLGYI